MAFFKLAHGSQTSPLHAGCGLPRDPLRPVLRPQIGLFDLEVNCLTKILFGALVVVSLVMVALQHFAGRWYLQIIRFLLLFSNIIPIRWGGAGRVGWGRAGTSMLGGVCGQALSPLSRLTCPRASGEKGKAFLPVQDDLQCGP